VGLRPILTINTAEAFQTLSVRLSFRTGRGAAIPTNRAEMRKRKCLLTLLAVALLGGDALAASENSNAGGQRSMAALMEQGQQALLAGDYRAARDAFSDLLMVDPRNQMASEGATFAYVQLGDYLHARPELEKALEIASPPSRPSAVNGAAIYLHAKKPLRAIKLLVDYMTPLSEVDEVALNALAITLNQTDEQSRKSRLYTDGVKFYGLQNTKLEKLRPGMKRWGVKWLPADEADQKSAAWNAALASTMQLERDLAMLKSHLAVVERNQRDPAFQQKLQIQNYWRARKPVDPSDELDAGRLKNYITAKQADYEKAVASAEKPPIPDSIDLINIVAEPPLVLPEVREEVATSQPTTSPTSAPTTAPVAADTTQPVVATTSPSPVALAKTHRVTSYAAGFPVGPNLLVTAADGVADATDIQVQAADGAAYPATLVRSDPETGLALLRVPAAKFAALNLADHFGGGSLSCVSFPSVDLFQPTATILNGSAAAPGRGWHVHLFESPRLGGGPLVVGGKVVGVELASRDSDINAIPAVTLEDLRKFLGSDISPDSAAVDAVAATVQISAMRDK
jgi:tetratricopeptide (TPR) repeat protein